MQTTGKDWQLQACLHPDLNLSQVALFLLKTLLRAPELSIRVLRETRVRPLS